MIDIKHLQALADRSSRMNQRERYLCSQGVGLELLKALPELLAELESARKRLSDEVEAHEFTANCAVSRMDEIERLEAENAALQVKIKDECQAGTEAIKLLTARLEALRKEREEFRQAYLTLALSGKPLAIFQPGDAEALHEAYCCVEYCADDDPTGDEERAMKVLERLMAEAAKSKGAPCPDK